MSLVAAVLCVVTAGIAVSHDHTADWLVVAIAPAVAMLLASRERSVPIDIRELLGLGAALWAGGALAHHGNGELLIVSALAALGIALSAVYERPSLLILATLVGLGGQLDALVGLGAAAGVEQILSMAATIVVALMLSLPWSSARALRARTADLTTSTEAHLAVIEFGVLLAPDGTILDIGANAVQLLGLGREEAIGTDFFELAIEPDARPQARRLFGDDGTDAAREFEHSLLVSRGARTAVLRWRVVRRSDRDGSRWIYAAGTDIDELREAERQLQRDRGDLARLAELARAVARDDDARQAVVDGGIRLMAADVACFIEPDPDGTALVITHASKEELIDVRLPLAGGPSASAATFHSGRQLFIPDAANHPLVHPGMREAADAASFLFQPVYDDGDVAAVVAFSWSEPRSELGARLEELAGLVAEETSIAVQRLGRMRRLTDAANSDALTGLRNRRAFDALMEETVRELRPEDPPFAVGLLDLNGFKALNDTAGHAAGDRVLRECASLWLSVLRPEDTLARFGGDEFAVLLRGCDLEGAEATSARLREIVRHPAGCGIGVAAWDGRESIATLLERADQALYADKARQSGGRITDSARLAAVERTGRIGRGADPVLDALASQAASLLDVCTTGVTLMTAESVHLVGGHGLPPGLELSRVMEGEASYCTQVVATGNELAATDVQEHPVLRDLATDRGGPVRGYAGVPIEVDGETVGTFCAFDDQPRRWSDEDLAVLRSFARRAAAILAAPAPAPAPAPADEPSDATLGECPRSGSRAG